MEHFFRAIKDAIPSVTEQMEREYEKLARKVKQQSARIGFTGVELEEEMPPEPPPGPSRRKSSRR
jgi:hypothetical protein